MKCSLEIILSLSLLCMEADVAHSLSTVKGEHEHQIKLHYCAA